jgi:hypothetical protein
VIPRARRAPRRATLRQALPADQIGRRRAPAAPAIPSAKDALADAPRALADFAAGARRKPAIGVA